MKKLINFFRGDKSQRDDLIRFFCQAVKETESCEVFVKHAENSGDKILVEFFKEIRAQDRLRIYRIEQLIKTRLTNCDYVP